MMFKFEKDSRVTKQEEERVGSIIKIIEQKLSFSNEQYSIKRINQDKLEQFFVCGENNSFSKEDRLKSRNNFSLSTAGFFDDEKRKFGSCNLKTFRIYSSSLNPQNGSDLKNNFLFPEIELLIKSLTSTFKRNGIKKINIIVNVNYSFNDNDFFYDFKVKEIGTSVFDGENTQLDEKREFTLTQSELENYIKNKKVSIKEFMHDFNLMNVQYFGRKEFLKNYKDCIQQLLLINY